MISIDHLKTMTTARLIDLREMTSKMQHSIELAKVRSWLTDEIEKRNPAGFDKWLDEETLDEQLRAYILD